MKAYLILLPVFFLALLQGSFLGFNLVLLLVLFYVVLKQNRQSLWVAFWSGLILDLAKGHYLGLSALIFLFFSFLLILYFRRFQATNWLFLVIFVALFSGAYSLLVYRFFDWKEVLFLIILALLVRFILRFFSIELATKQIRLRN